MQLTAIKPYQKWRWSGDEVVSEPIIPAPRTVPGTSTRGYPLDVRELLGHQSSAVIRATLDQVLDGLSPDERARFTARVRGSYDFRADAIVSWVTKNVRYVARGRRAQDWLYPAETLATRAGDCEDIAFLLHALLEESGISPYCLRVAFGSMRVRVTGAPEKAKASDHVWVV